VSKSHGASLILVRIHRLLAVMMTFNDLEFEVVSDVVCKCSYAQHFRIFSSIQGHGYFGLKVCTGTETECHPTPSAPQPRRLTLVNVDTEHNILMNTTRRKQKEGFGPSPIQDYKVCRPCRKNKPSTESLESIVRLSSILPQYYRQYYRRYRRHCSPSPQYAREM